MDSTTFINPITEINDKTLTTVENILLNRSRVLDWYEDTDDETVFYYRVSEDVKDKAIKIKSQYPILQFETIFSETAPNLYVVVNVTRINKNCRSYDDTGGLKTDSVISKIRIPIKNIVWARTYGDYQYLWFDRGAHNYVLIETTDTLSEINATASNSGSLP